MNTHLFVLLNILFVTLTVGCVGPTAHLKPEASAPSLEITAKSLPPEKEKLPLLMVYLRHVFEDKRVTTYQSVALATEGLTKIDWPVGNPQQASKPTYAVRFILANKSTAQVDGYLCMVRWLKSVGGELEGKMSCEQKGVLPQGALAVIKEKRMLSAQDPQELALEISQKAISLLDFSNSQK